MEHAIEFVPDDDDLDEARPVDTGWSITDDSSAEYAISQIRAGREHLEKMRCWYAAQLEALETRTRNDEAYLLSKLDQYLDTVPTHDTRTMRKYSLPSADLIRKKPAPKFTHDDALLLPFLKSAGKADCIKVTESVAWSDLKKALSSPDYIQMADGTFAMSDTGEIVPGVTVEDQPERFDIKLR